jgi:hypothetical protein
VREDALVIARARVEARKTIESNHRRKLADARQAQALFAERAVAATRGMARTDVCKQRARNIARHFWEGYVSANNLTYEQELACQVPAWLEGVMEAAMRFGEAEERAIAPISVEEYAKQRAHVRVVTRDERRVLVFEGSFVGKVLSLRAAGLSPLREGGIAVFRAATTLVVPSAAPSIWAWVWEGVLAAGVILAQGARHIPRVCDCSLAEESFQVASFVDFERPLVGGAEHTLGCVVQAAYQGLPSVARVACDSASRVLSGPAKVCLDVVKPLVGDVATQAARVPLSSVMRVGGVVLAGVGAYGFLNAHYRGVGFKSLRED